MIAHLHLYPRLEAIILGSNNLDHPSYHIKDYLNLLIFAAIKEIAKPIFSHRDPISLHPIIES